LLFPASGKAKQAPAQDPAQRGNHEGSADIDKIMRMLEYQHDNDSDKRNAERDVQVSFSYDQDADKQAGSMA
jgi:hypothetical protein